MAPFFVLDFFDRGIFTLEVFGFDDGEQALIYFDIFPKSLSLSMLVWVVLISQKLYLRLALRFPDLETFEYFPLLLFRQRGKLRYHLFQCWNVVLHIQIGQIHEDLLSLDVRVELMITLEFFTCRFICF